MGKKCSVKGCPSIKNLSRCKNEEQYILWKRTINYTGKCNQKSFFICFKHFSASQFYRDLQQELLGTTRRRRLLPTAVPDTDINGCATLDSKNEPENYLSDDCVMLRSESVPRQENSRDFDTLHKTCIPESNLSGFRSEKQKNNEISTQADTDPLKDREVTGGGGTTIRRKITVNGATAIGGATTVDGGTTANGATAIGGATTVGGKTTVSRLTTVYGATAIGRETTTGGEGTGLGGKILGGGINNQRSLLPSSTKLDNSKSKQTKRRCAVKGCVKRTTLTGCRSEEQYLLWKKAINYSGKRSQHTFHICRNHFSKSQFYRDLQEELLGLPKRFHRLLPTAVPDINLNGCDTSNNTNMPDKYLSNDCATLFDINESDSKLFGFQTGNNKINEVSTQVESELLLDERITVGEGTTIVGGTTVSGGITLVGGTTVGGGMSNQCLLIPLSLTTLDNSKGSSGILDHKIFYTVVPMPPQLLQNPCTQRQHVPSELTTLRTHKQSKNIRANASESLEDISQANNEFKPLFKIETSSERLNFDKFGHITEEKATLNPLDNPTSSEGLEHMEDEEVENDVIKPSLKIETVDEFKPLFKIETSSERLNFDEFGHKTEEKATLNPLDNPTNSEGLEHMEDPTNSEGLEHMEDEEIENYVIKPSVKIETVDVDFFMEDLEDPLAGY